MSAQRKRVNRLRALEWARAREAALERDGHRCRAADYGLDSPCQSFPPGPVVHHMRRRKGVDKHALPWLVTLCGFHHVHVHANVAESYANGLLVKSQVADTEESAA